MPCMAAIYFQDAEAIKQCCRVTTEPPKFILERLNGTSFVSVAKQSTTAQIQCGSRRSVRQLEGTQIGTLGHSCSIMVGYSAMTASCSNSPVSIFLIRANLDSLTEGLQDWGNNQQLTIIGSIDGSICKNSGQVFVI